MADKNGTAMIITMVPIRPSPFGVAATQPQYHSRPTLSYVPSEKWFESCRLCTGLELHGHYQAAAGLQMMAMLTGSMDRVTYTLLPFRIVVLL